MLLCEYKCLIGLGSNIGDKERNIHQGIERISQSGRLENISALYQTQPWGNADQDFFINAVVTMHTLLSPWELLEELKVIEQHIGKEKKVHWGPRKIDLDILYFGQKIIFEKSLIIPHPFLHLRNFVLVPMRDVAAVFLHPVFKKTTTELLSVCPDKSLVELYLSESECADNHKKLF